MFAFNILLALCMSVIKLSSGNVYAKTPCVNIEPVHNFDLDQLLGVWYEITRYDNDLETEARCVISTYAFNDHKYTYKFNYTLNKEPLSYSGPLTVVSKHLGILDYYSSVFKNTEKSSDMIVDVVAFESDCVAFYYCKYDETNKLSHDYLWIISRDKMYTDKTKEFVENFINNTSYVDKSRLVWQSFTDPSCQ